MRIPAIAAALILLASGTVAQEQPDLPQIDASILDSCLKDGGAESCIGRAAAECSTGKNGHTTIGMSHCLGQELDLWDSRLNKTYDLLAEQSGRMDQEMEDLGSAADKQLPHLRQMQQDWIAYRDSACAYEASLWGGGSGAGPAQVSCALTLTARQVVWLKNYLQE